MILFYFVLFLLGKLILPPKNNNSFFVDASRDDSGDFAFDKLVIKNSFSSLELLPSNSSGEHWKIKFSIYSQNSQGALFWALLHFY
jgi:hypothetical protein